MDAARTARPEDAQAITDLARSAIAELSILRGGGLWQLHAARQEPIEASVDADIAMTTAQGIAVVGTIDDVVVGYGVSRLTPLADGSPLAIIADLYVHPEARGVGVGEAMMDAIVEHARTAGAVGVDSLALPGDRATKNFFETFGLKARAIVVHRSLVDDEEEADG